MTINSNGYQNTVNPYYNTDQNTDKKQNSAENLQEQDVNKAIEKRNDDLRRGTIDVISNVSQTLNSYSAEQLSKVHDLSKISANILDISI